jgi:CheY-like chemotaxis protein
MTNSNRPGRRLRVLVIEDNRATADTLRVLFDLRGHEVRVAYDGPTGVDAAREWPPDVVLCDIGLPGLDGYGVAAALLDQPATHRPHLIAVTAYGSEEARRRSEQVGFEKHLVKPVDPEVLLELLAGLSGPRGNGMAH